MAQDELRHDMADCVSKYALGERVQATMRIGSRSWSPAVVTELHHTADGLRCTACCLMAKACRQCGMKLNYGNRERNKMEETLYEMFARRAWEAMNPDGVPWQFLPQEQIKDRMREAMGDVLALMGIENVEETGLSTFQAEWVKRQTISECGHDFVTSCPICGTEHCFAHTQNASVKAEQMNGRGANVASQQ